MLRQRETISEKLTPPSLSLALVADDSAENAPLMNDYTWAFVKHRLPSTFLGGFKFPDRQISHVPIGVYLLQTVLFLMPMIVAAILTGILLDTNLQLQDTLTHICLDEL